MPNWMYWLLALALLILLAVLWLVGIRFQVHT